MTNELAKQLKDALKTRFGRNFNVSTYRSARGETMTVVCPKSRVDKSRWGFSVEESLELSKALGISTYEDQLARCEFTIPDVVVADAIANLATKMPQDITKKISAALAAKC